ncbi:dimethylarginine dimethylaminohydrolase family protein [Vibrio mediterranei]|uniref:dimethylarginine dimethylaminohydrolase family protein n=3 Tax=Vibrio TaxID=662 RepID=UPI00148D2B26|nr:hypothetical protein [Vibrio mediterranei]NOI25240.1 hypothetical protein [Vibrio mediterranei]
MSKISTQNQVYVPAATKHSYGEFNLYGKLQEVVVGYSQNFRLPVLTEEVKATYQSVLQSDLYDLCERAGGQLLSHASPSFSAALERENDALIKAFQGFGVKVHQAREVPEGEIAACQRTNVFTQIFAAEPIWVVGRNVLENVWASDMSWASIAPVRELHQPFIDGDNHILHYTAPRPTLSRDYIYEGGDVLNLGDGRVLVATGSSSTNTRGAEWVKRMLEHDGYQVCITEVEDTGIHHLFAVMCVAGPKLVIAYRDAFPNGLPEFMDDFDVVWANREEALATGPCAVMLDENHILMPEETPALNRKLEAKGLTVVTVPFAHHAKLCGGIRCKTSVLRRDIN